MMDAINAGKYASGGPVDGGNLTPAYITGMASTFQSQATAAMVASMQAAMKAAVTAAAKAAAASAASSTYTKTGAGDYTLAQLEALWIQAGGNPAVAYNMARIAIAESGGNPNAYNASGATGLWQILGAVVSGNLYNPLVNAKNAVAKYNAGGYAPWESDPAAAGLLGMAQGGLIGGPAAPFPWTPPGMTGGPSAPWQQQGGPWPWMPWLTGQGGQGGGMGGLPALMQSMADAGGLGLTRADLGLPATIPAATERRRARTRHRTRPPRHQQPRRPPLLRPPQPRPRR